MFHKKLRRCNDTGIANGNEPLGMGGNGVEKDVPAYLLLSAVLLRGLLCLTMLEYMEYTKHESEYGYRVTRVVPGLCCFRQ